MSAPTDTVHASFDTARAEEFGGRVFEMVSSSVVVMMIDLAARTGLLDALVAGSGTSDDLATRAGLQERYVRECLGSLVAGGIVDYDATARSYSIPAEHAACLTGGGPTDLAPMARMATVMAPHVPAVATAFREGGGVPYEAFRPEFTVTMDLLSRGLLDGHLLQDILPTAGLVEQFRAGARVADIGCGTGHAINLMAGEFPASTFTGFDFSAEAVDAGRKEAAELGLSNATFEVRDVSTLPEGSFDVVFAIDSIHDQRDPAGVLRAVHDALAPGGTFVMIDIKANSALEDNLDNPFAPLLYGISTLHCMTVSLALGGAGLGTVWGEQTARTMLAEAGFEVLAVHDVPDDPLDSVYVSRRD
ncbi:class I SAM-dependent methyltransferase [Sporichthya polymorpha]|uniref:class I SAM-dependent methyltransferase n=1 Tax=Sporichthya polymorpha TaxID=35751 RepID=UPI00035FC36A|nr:class I SAM-dependent methyltransferase [Sporichthya polymorpha]